MSIATQLSVRQLRAFVSVYRLRKLSDAASALSVTPAAISVLIRQIEDNTGLTMFDRTTRALQPTKAAHEAIGIAERILRDIDLLGSRLEDLNARRQGRVAVAVTPAISLALLPPVVRAFKALHPGVQFVLDDCSPNEFVSRILSGHVDLAIGTTDSRVSGLDQRTLLRDELCVICAEDHPLARLAEVPWRALDGVPLIAGEPGYGVRRLLDATAARAGIHLNVTNEVRFHTSVMWMVACGQGVAVFPRGMVQQGGQAGLASRPLVAPRVTRDISLITRSAISLSPAAQSFEEVLLAHVAQLRGEGHGLPLKEAKAAG
jgi:DNA-binding transcriptional LysR family regulator